MILKKIFFSSQFKFQLIIFIPITAEQRVYVGIVKKSNPEAIRYGDIEFEIFI